MRREMEMSQFEAMVAKMIDGGATEPPADEEREVASDLLGELTWQEREPLARRIGRVRGMVSYLRGRPLPRTRGLLAAELELLDTLGQLRDWAEELDRGRPEGLAEELLFAATQEFFELVEWLDEAWPL